MPEAIRCVSILLLPIQGKVGMGSAYAPHDFPDIRQKGVKRGGEKSVKSGKPVQAQRVLPA